MSRSSLSKNNVSKRSNKVCPPNTFSVLNGCSSWSSILAIMAFLALLVLISVCYIIATQNTKHNNKINIIDNATIANSIANPKAHANLDKHIEMIKNNISNSIKYNTQEQPITHLQTRTAPQFEISQSSNPYDGIDSNDKIATHNNTGTPISDRIQYDINVNIRDVDGARQNPNNISYGTYEYEKNMERIINPIIPPERSYVNTYGIPINIPSRGPRQTYQQVGILYKENTENTDKQSGNNTDSNILPLFGRPSYSGSKRWHYYTNSDKYNAIKLPISIDGRKCTDDLGCNELMNGDMISIPSYNGRFKVEIYGFDSPQYIPYVY